MTSVALFGEFLAAVCALAMLAVWFFKSMK